MSAVAAPLSASPQLEGPQDPRPRRWTREEYYRAAELGLFGPEERLELIRGEILQKVSPQKQSHITAVLLSEEGLEDAFRSVACHVRVQGPITLPNDSEPEPDLLVVSGRVRDYETRHPGPADVLLLVEVSDSTLRYDQTVKAALYAEAGIAEYWIVNLPERRLEVHRHPQGSGYADVTPYAERESVTPLSAPGASVRVADLLPSLSS
jgi:Uma2 family endonuclease